MSPAPVLAYRESIEQPRRVLVGDGIRLATVRWTAGGVRPLARLVLVHGFAGERTENGLFSHLGRRLSGHGIEVIAYDWRGLGESDGEFANTRIEDHVDDFLGIVQSFQHLAAGDAPVLALGFSLGAAVVGLALPRMQSPAGVVFLSPALRPRVSMSPRYCTREHSERLKADGFILKPDNGVRLGPEILDSLATTDLGPQALDLGVPTLVCHGTEDSRIPFSGTVCLVEAAAHRPQFVPFPGASHSFRPKDSNWSLLSGRVQEWILGTAIPPVRQPVPLSS